jgi:hypothetical protein
VKAARVACGSPAWRLRRGGTDLVIGDLAIGEAGLFRVAAHGVLAHDGAGSGGVLADHSHGEAVQDAEPVVEALHVAGVQREALGGLLVGAWPAGTA